MVSIEISEERGVRHLHFGSHWVQGAMRIARPWALELEYTRERMLPLLLHSPRAWRGGVRQVGLGAAVMTGVMPRHRPETQVTVVEILPEVVAAARQFFKLPEESDRLRIEIADGYDYVARSKRRFDLIVVDGFDEDGRAGMLDTLSFYLNCRARLAANGMLAANFLRSTGHVAATTARPRKAFEHLLVLPPCDAGNTVALRARLASPARSPEELHAAALRLKADTGLCLVSTVARLADATGNLLA